jgi:tryptophan 2,3-dioxygenase
MNPYRQGNHSLDELLEKLSLKFAASGQDLNSYLEGLLHEKYLTYWDYIQLDTLLSLQKPKTAIPDEQIFIIYHQITELYFRLILLEMDQIHLETGDEEFLTRLERINRYFKNLVQSFDVMVDGMDQQQFLQFRMSLLPASGFQSAQYRMIEIRATPFINLVDKEVRSTISPDAEIELMFEHIYWKKGATELATGKKTLTLESFEEKYAQELIDLARAMKGKTLGDRFQQGVSEPLLPQVIKALRRFDSFVNVNWPLAHYKSAVRYLERNPEDIAATGGTNWQKYLPPRFQKRIFFKNLFTEQELAEWGKSWVEKEVFGITISD